ncbi:Putative exosome complex exonuclease RRP42 OS=Dictyostelium discoideum GN=exosc7 PE=3 SV=1 [Rhizoctonia solani AG-1 IB]|uniref:Ribosomal RNA-processing protein 42 n=1 Tax=Thanatephorus cucumeris (strain AG1-IB / isolate 7/3/14) TaxID=1108050 RepID=A0A0B7F436_THACB|nr:Putative exosome complex exonuclease RRP42 OS=Dictyostelium discoideum GN=exosc7 PE=3 SV=1 [Rhizoctonia solani AG-1 IB]
MYSLSKAEIAYIRSALVATTSDSGQLRGDGRGTFTYRSIGLELGMSPATNGSARARVGGTEVWTGIKLEVETNETKSAGASGRDGGRVEFAVTCTSGSHPHLSGQAIEDLSLEYSNQSAAALTSFLVPSPQFTIVPGYKSWLIHVDSLVISDDGNLVDVLWMAIRGALWDLRIPRTNPISFRTRDSDKRARGDAFGGAVKSKYQSTGGRSGAGDFELPDYWDDGEPLDNRHSLPVSVTYNLLPPVYFLDASMPEELSVPNRLSLVFSCPNPTCGAPSKPLLLSTWLNAPVDLNVNYLKAIIKDCEARAAELARALDQRMSSDE